MRTQLREYDQQKSRVWQIWYSINGFKFCILVEGTENEMRDYVSSELSMRGITGGGYHGISDSEVKCAKEIGLPIYLAPEIHDERGR